MIRDHPESPRDAGFFLVQVHAVAAWLDGDPEGDADGDDPYATAVVKWDGVSSYSNAFDYIGVGDYKLALSCQAALDEPDTNAGELV